MSDIFRKLNDHLPGKELFIRFTAWPFVNCCQFFVFSCFPFVFEGRIWDLIVSVPDHCLSFCITKVNLKAFEQHEQIYLIISFAF